MHNAKIQTKIRKILVTVTKNKHPFLKNVKINPNMSY